MTCVAGCGLGGGVEPEPVHEIASNTTMGTRFSIRLEYGYPFHLYSARISPGDHTPMMQNQFDFNNSTTSAGVNRIVRMLRVDIPKLRYIV